MIKIATLKSLVSDAQRLLRLGPEAWMDFLRASLELTIALGRLKRRVPADYLQDPRQPPDQSDDLQVNSSLIDRIVFAIPRVAARLPWRADCLIQALAAQRWLQREGVTTTLHIGVRNEGLSWFEAHAWLTCGERIVTGGDISGYSTLKPAAPEFPVDAV